MKIDTTKDVWVDVKDLPKTYKGIDWENCIGLKVSFKYYNLNGEFDILKYEKNKHLLTIQYKNKLEKKDIFS